MSWLSNWWGDVSGSNAQKQASAEAAAQAKALQAREDKRQADIKAGQGKIDESFAQFNPDYYNQFRTTYLNNYNPQIADQFSQARDKLTATLAGRGMLESTTGANAFGKIAKTRGDAEATVANSATDAANQLRSNVENTKSNLFNLNLSAADPAAIGAQAQAQATSIVSPASMPGLGNVFQSALQPFANYSKADNTSMNPQLPWNRMSTMPTGRGSAIFGN